MRSDGGRRRGGKHRHRRTTSDVNALTVEVTVAGATFDGDDFANGLLNASPINGVTYDCSGASPVLDFMTADPGVTVPVALTPA